MKLKKINFDIYICTHLKKEAVNIDLMWDAKSYEVSNGELKIILKNLYRKNSLRNREGIKLISNISEVKSLLGELKLDTIEGFFIKIKNSFTGDISLIKLKNLDLFYDTILIFYQNSIIIENLYFIINEILKLNTILNKNLSKKTYLIFEILKSDKSICDFFTERFLESTYRYIGDIFEFEMDFYIGRATDLFCDIIKNIFTKYIRNIIISKTLEINRLFFNLFKECKYTSMEKIDIYKKIINIYSDKNIIFSKITDLWFYDILSFLGEIKNRNKDWNYFTEDEKNIFKKWFFGEKLDEFFGRNVKDPERTKFWKGYVHCLRDIKFYRDIAEAIIMEFENHTIIEFGKKNNAAYVYPRSFITIDKVNSYLSIYSKTTIKDIKLKNHENAIPLKVSNMKSGWNHPKSGWQQSFKFRLRELGYKEQI
ncbi:hypothetical protein [Cetobacterium ceti]